MYDLKINAITSTGTRLDTVMLPHEPHDADKIARLREDMIVNGWRGRPVILIDCGDHHRALTGVHRLTSAAGIDGLIEDIGLPDDLTADDYNLIDGANDDQDLLSALREIADNRNDMDDLLAVMQAEVDAG